MTDAVNVAYGGVLFIGVNVLAAYVAHVATRRLLGSAPMSTRLAASGVLLLAGIVLLAQIVSLFGLYTRNVTALVVVGAAILANRAWGSLATVRDDARTIWRWVRSTLLSLGAIGLVLAWTALAVLTWRAMTRRPMGWDSLTYHLPSAAAYVQSGRLVPVEGPFAMDPYAHYPKNGEIIASWLLLPFHSDLAVGLMGVALLIFCWVAIYAMARALGVASRDAALGATAVCTSPFLYSWASSQNVDSMVTATLVISLLFLIRFLSSGNGADGFLACLAAGLALGTKYTALPVGLLILGVLTIAATVRLGRSGRLARLPAWVAVGVLVAGAVGARQYVVNAVTARNPIYPLTVSVGEHRIAPGSPYLDWLVERVGPGDLERDQFELNATFRYFPDWKTPTTAGPKFAGLIPLAVLAALFVRGRRGWVIRLVVAFAIIEFVVSHLPSGGLVGTSRRFWPSTSRFLGASFSLFAAAALTTLSRLKPWAAYGLRAALVGCIVWDFAAVGQYLIDEPRGAGAWRDYASAFEVEGAPKKFIPGWRFVDQQAPLRIALATGTDLYGQNRFAYPLMGSRLQNTVLYVPVNDIDPPGSKAFILRENPHFPEWLHALDERHVQLVCEQSPWPIEDQWMHEHPERFRLVFDTPDFRAYETLASKQPM